jgi:hypothetical protein
MTTGPSRTFDTAFPHRPVSISGIGAVSGYGWGEKLLREGLYTSESAVRCHSGFSPAFDDDWGWVALIDDAGDPEDGPSRMMRAVRHAGREAVHNAFDRGWRPGGVVGSTVSSSVMSTTGASTTTGWERGRRGAIGWSSCPRRCSPGS